MSDQQKAVEILPNQHSDEKFGVSIMQRPQDLKTLLSGTVFKNLDKLESSPLNIAMQYYDFTEGVPVRFVFIGIGQRASQDTGELIDSVILVDQNRDTYCNMSAILVGTFIDQNVAPGTPVEVTRIGEKKTAKGRAYTWRVLPLIQQPEASK